jgi:hypothetical protein
MGALAHLFARWSEWLMTQVRVDRGELLRRSSFGRLKGEQIASFVQKQ